MAKPAYDYEVMKHIDSDTMMSLSYMAMLDAENNKKRTRSDFKTDWEYKYYMDDIKDYRK